MAADPSIYNALMQPRKSAFDYANEFEDQAYQREQRGTQRQMNALQMQQAQQAMADDQAYRDAARDFGADTDANANMLLQKGLAKQAIQYRKDALEGTKTKSEIQLNASKAQEQQASAAEKQFRLEQDRRQKHLQELVGVNDVPSAHAWLDQAVASGELPPDKVAQVKAQLQANPNMLQQWKQGAIAGGFTLQQQRENEWKQREFSLKQDQQLEQQRHNRSTEGLTARGQDMTDARAREANANTFSKPFEVTGPDGSPVLVRQGKNGAIQPVEGFGPKAGASKPLTEGQGKALEFGSRMRESNKIIDSLAGDGVETTLPGSGGTGLMGRAVTAVSGEKRQQLEQAKRDWINAKLRKESGAVIGQSEFESADRQYFPQPGDSKAVIEQKRRNRAIAEQGVLAEVPEGKRDSIVKPSAAPASVKTDADYAALPSGSVFVGPDGKTRRKP